MNSQVEVFESPVMEDGMGGRVEYEFLDVITGVLVRMPKATHLGLEFVSEHSFSAVKVVRGEDGKVNKTPVAVSVPGHYRVGYPIDAQKYKDDHEGRPCILNMHLYGVLEDELRGRELVGTIQIVAKTINDGEKMRNYILVDFFKSEDPLAQPQYWLEREITLLDYIKMVTAYGGERAKSTHNIKDDVYLAVWPMFEQKCSECGRTVMTKKRHVQGSDPFSCWECKR